MLAKGFEPLRITPLDFESNVSSNFTMPANFTAVIYLKNYYFIEREKKLGYMPLENIEILKNAYEIIKNN